jgi:hypothetical protein
MKRPFTVSFSDTITSGGARDWLNVTTAILRPIRLRGFILSQTSQTGASAEELLRFSLLRIAVPTVGGNGTSVNAVQIDQVDNGASHSFLFNGTTLVSGGTPSTLLEFGWNPRSSPFEKWFDERFAPVFRGISEDQRMVLRQQTPLSTNLTAQATFWFEELLG